MRNLSSNVTFYSIPAVHQTFYISICISTLFLHSIHRLLHQEITSLLNYEAELIRVRLCYFEYGEMDRIRVFKMITQ